MDHLILLNAFESEYSASATEYKSMIEIIISPLVDTAFISCGFPFICDAYITQ